MNSITKLVINRMNLNFKHKPGQDNVNRPLQTDVPVIVPEIIETYHKSGTSGKEILSQNEKLIHHLTTLEEGVALFSQDKKVIINNNHFIQYINHVSDKLVNLAEDFYAIKDFAPLVKFFDKYTVVRPEEALIPLSYEINLIKNNKYFKVKCIIYQDKSMEVIIRDTTKLSKQKILKKQITGNIAHELKTPVSSISGYLETVLYNRMDKHKMLDFIRKAYLQTCRLTELINDITIITKIEEADKLYPLENVNLRTIITNIIEDFSIRLAENKVTVILDVNDDVEINGNPTLLYSIFKNLVENTLNYGGKNVEMVIKMYLDNGHHYCFSFYNSGNNVPESDLPRLFERFYRVEKGRDRLSGGSGLGLSIVKNAILFHNGDISVKNRSEGGLEFLFALSKDRNLKNHLPDNS